MKAKLFFISTIIWLSCSCFSLLQAQKVDVYSENGKYGLMVDQKRVTEPIFGLIYQPSGNLIKVAKDGKWEKNNNIDDVNELFPQINSEHKKERYEDGKFGLIDINGKICVPIEYTYIGSFNNGRAKAHIGDKQGIIDDKGNVIVPIEYTYIGSFDNGRAKVHIDDKQGIINDKGNIIVPIEYTYIGSFDNGRAKAHIGDKQGIIDDRGNVIVPIKYTYIGSFNNGRAKAHIGNIQILIDEKGNEIK